MFQTCCKLCVWCGVSGLVVALVPAYNEGHHAVLVVCGAGWVIISWLFSLFG